MTGNKTRAKQNYHTEWFLKTPKLLLKTSIGKHGSSPKEACKDQVPPNKGRHYRKRFGSQMAKIINWRSHRQGARRSGKMEV